ncbi:MAG: RNA methyltransferase [Chloroflexi bacterium HGW-Chloroflexi-10]|nr:MAG: RNA methyltransferase [Chloroflexi bacterium HGW-Chloroflexi-10]
MITSDKNQKIQTIRALFSQSKERKKSQTCVIEGVRLVEEAFAAQWQTESVFFADNLSERGRLLIDRFIHAGIPVEEVALSIMQKMTDTETSQGILAVMHFPQPSMPKQLDFILICDTIRDPGNLGTLLRTAAAAGVQAVLLTAGCTDHLAPKVLRAGMGAHFLLPVFKMEWPQIVEICKNNPQPLTIYMAAAEAPTSCWQADLRKPSAILVGNEAEGAGLQARQSTDMALSIPMPGKMESLNAAIAASILLFETVRQRST